MPFLTYFVKVTGELSKYDMKLAGQIRNLRLPSQRNYFNYILGQNYVSIFPQVHYFVW